MFISISSVQAAPRNLCDDIIESGNSTPEQIKKCQDKFGVSDYAKEQEANKNIQTEATKIQTDSEAKKKSNLETRKFTTEDLFDAGFGKPFVAMKIDYRYHPAKVDRITKGDILCNYLGYEKSIQSSLSDEIMPKEADKKALIIDTQWITGKAKDPEIYKDDDLRFTVRKYNEIVCIKRKDTDAEAYDDAFKGLIEDLKIDPHVNNPPKKDSNTKMDDGPRIGKERRTEHGYVRPEEDNQGTSK